MIATQKIQEKEITIAKDVISYYDNLTGEPTLFFIHGSFINKDYWQTQLYHFSPRYRVIAVDLAGHGKSTFNGDDFTIEKFGQTIAAMINKMELKNVILIGHSIGGDIMLTTNEKSGNNIIGLIGIDYFKNVGAALPDEVINQIMNDLRNNFVNTNVAYAKNTLLTEKTDKSITERVVGDFKSISPKVGIPMNEDFFHFPQKEETLLSKLNKRIYLVNTDYQPTNEASLEKTLKDNYQLKIIKGSSHFPMIENPVDLNDTLENFIEDILDK